MFMFILMSRNHHGCRSYILNTPYVVSSIGAFKLAERASANIRRVSAGSMTPSSQSLAGVVGVAFFLVLFADGGFDFFDLGGA